MDYHDCGLTGLTFERPSLVKPQFAADCDLSTIVRRFVRTGELPTMHQRPNIGDASAYPESFQELQDRLAFVRSEFESLPPEEREKYQNSPELWIEMKAMEESNHEQKDDKSQEEHLENGAQDPAQKGTGEVDPPPPPEA